jgi:hypothetical protein
LSSDEDDEGVLAVVVVVGGDDDDDDGSISLDIGLVVTVVVVRIVGDSLCCVEVVAGWLVWTASTGNTVP